MTPPFYRNKNKLLPLDYYLYHIKKFLHWNFGIHWWKVLEGKTIWCNFCGSKFEAHDFLFDKMYKK